MTATTTRRGALPVPDFTAKEFCAVIGITRTSLATAVYRQRNRKARDGAWPADGIPEPDSAPSYPLQRDEL